MIVADASAAVTALLNAGPARRALVADQVHVPHLIDAEIANVLRRRVGGGDVRPTAAWAALDTWRRLGLIRHPVIGLLARIWLLRDNLTAYDACYVALAERLDCALLTCDVRLGRAPGVRCPVTVMPR